MRKVFMNSSFIAQAAKGELSTTAGKQMKANGGFHSVISFSNHANLASYMH